MEEISVVTLQGDTVLGVGAKKLDLKKCTLLIGEPTWVELAVKIRIPSSLAELRGRWIVKSARRERIHVECTKKVMR